MRFGDMNTGDSNMTPASNSGFSGEVISLSKGQAISLDKVAPGLKRVVVGLGWDPINQGVVGADFDLDASCFLLNDSDKAAGAECLIFYNNLIGANGAVQHMGDNLTGSGDGDDEQIKIDFEKVPSNISKIAVTVTIYDYENRRQNFGMVHNSFVRVVDETSGNEIIRYDLGEEFSTETAIIACEFYRHNGDWKMRAVGQGYAGGLKALGQSFGLNVQ